MKRTANLLLSIMLLSLCSCNKDYLYSLLHPRGNGEDTTAAVPAFNKVYGGTNRDGAASIAKANDGGYVVAGSAQSLDNDVTGNHGLSDAWVFKVDNLGKMLWQKALGGPGYDGANSVVATPDGGSVIAGYAAGGGDVKGNHGFSDAWVVKLDRLGNLVWQKALGGSSTDEAYSISSSSDGGYLVAGRTASIDGDVNGNHGGFDAWVIKLDASGTLIWQKVLGGSGYDGASSVISTAGGGCIVAGFTTSKDGDASGNHGNLDAWLVSLDGKGNIQWQKEVGGGSDDEAKSITSTADGGLIMAGGTRSYYGDATGSYEGGNAWIVKLDKAGNTLWQKALGGTDFDYAFSVATTADGGYVMAGTASSKNGDVTGVHGGADAWIVKLDGGGNKLWQKALGGTGYDGANSILTTADGGYIIAGDSFSNDGDVSGNHGLSDAWVFILKNP